MAKATGAEIAKFYKEGWPKGFYHDDFEISIDDDNGDSLLNPEELYDLSKFGVLVPEVDFTLNPAARDEIVDFKSVFLKWKKAQNFVTLVVEVPKENEVDFRTQMKSFGYKVK